MSDQNDPGGEPRESAKVPTSGAEPARREEAPPTSQEKPRRAPESKAPSKDAKKRDGAGGAESSVPSSRAALLAFIALAAGATLGWFGHGAQAKAKLRDESAPATAGSGAARGPCGAWEQKICTSSGDQSAACQEAKVAAGLLTPSTCVVAIEAIPATL